MVAAPQLSTQGVTEDGAGSHTDEADGVEEIVVEDAKQTYRDRLAMVGSIMGIVLPTTEKGVMLAMSAPQEGPPLLAMLKSG